jgi:hypothetical protein
MSKGVVRSAQPLIISLLFRRGLRGSKRQIYDVEEQITELLVGNYNTYSLDGAPVNDINSLSLPQAYDVHHFSWCFL